MQEYRAAGARRCTPNKSRVPPCEVGRLLAPDRQETLGIPDQVAPPDSAEICWRPVRVERCEAPQPLRRALAD